MRICVLRLVKRIFVVCAALHTSVLLRCNYVFVLPILEYWLLPGVGVSSLLGSGARSWPRSWSSASRASGVFCWQALPWSEFLVGVCSTSCCWNVYVVQGWFKHTHSWFACSVGFHLLQPEFDILESQLQLVIWSLNYQGAERANLQGVSCQCRPTSHV